MTQRWCFLLIATFLLTPGANAAETCAAAAVSAQGEPSAFEWIARTKARANWRSRIRATKDLGADYSSWTRASSRDERCNPTPKGIVCSFTGTPCKP